MTQKKKNPHAVALGRRGGRKGGPARAASMSAEQRSANARYAAEMRWAKRENSPALIAQIRQGYQDYLAGRTRPIEEFMAELEEELNVEDNNQEDGN